MICKNDICVFEERHRILLQAKEFICLSPHFALREYISNYNITFPTKAIMPEGFTIMPSGCATLTISSDGNCLFADLDGPTTKPLIVGSKASHPKMILTIEFKPAGLFALTGITQSEITDKTISFDIVNPKLTALAFNIVEASESTNELITGLDMLFLENMYGEYHPQLKLVFHNILSNAGVSTIKSLSNSVHYSERQLNRIFKQHVGVSAKSFSRLIRVNKAFRLLNKPHHSLTFVSDMMGFHDLSHFLRDFKLVCGVSPQEYRNNMSDFYINPTKF